MTVRTPTTNPTPALIHWAFSFPDDPVAQMVIASIPPDKVPTLKEAVLLENQNHEAITQLLKNILNTK